MFQFHFANGHPDDPAFKTFLKIFKSKVRHSKTSNLQQYFQIPSNVIPDNIKRPECEEIENGFTDFADSWRNAGSSRFTARPTSIGFITNCNLISMNYEEIRNFIVGEPAVSTVNWYQRDDGLLYDELLQQFRTKSTDRNYINKITDEMINDMQQNYNDIVRRLIAQMNVLKSTRSQYVELAKPKVKSLSLSSMLNVFETLGGPQQTLIEALDNTLKIVYEFNLYRVQLARKFMTL